MSTNGAVESFEIERKYAVDDACTLPSAAQFARIGLLAAPPERIPMVATYFDTPNGALGAQRVAVRVRRGGADEGWHMKVKGPDGSRELVWPVAADMPAGLHQEIVDRIGADAASRLVAIASLETVRIITRLSRQGENIPVEAEVEAKAGTGTEAGAEAEAEVGTGTAAGTATTDTWLVELADDRVVATNGLAGTTSEWREWEAELAPAADPAVLDDIETLLVAVGAERVRGMSKLQRALGRPSDPTV